MLGKSARQRVVSLLESTGLAYNLEDEKASNVSL